MTYKTFFKYLSMVLISFIFLNQFELSTRCSPYFSITTVRLNHNYYNNNLFIRKETSVYTAQYQPAQ